MVSGPLLMVAALAGMSITGTARADAQAWPTIRGAALRSVDFRDLKGWADDRHEDAFAAFRLGCASPQPLRAGLAAPPELDMACKAALALANPGRAEARAFFETHFQPLRVAPEAGGGFLTGYFEPEFEGSIRREEGYPTPLYGRPPDLVTLDQGQPAPGLGALQAARRLPDGSLAAYPVRAEIDEGSVARDWPVVAWLRDPVDRFVMQVQGSARLRLPDGSIARIAYAGRNGHPYVSLGRLLSQEENIPPAEMTMDRLVARLKADPAWARSFIARNPSFVFFRLAGELGADQGPIGGAGVPLTPHRSIAADRTLWPYGLPAWLSGEIPTRDRGRVDPLARLAIIQDTGSAIVGPARFDLFFGSGPEAGFVAGLTRHGVEATILWPRSPGPGRP